MTHQYAACKGNSDTTQMTSGHPLFFHKSLLRRIWPEFVTHHSAPSRKIGELSTTSVTNVKGLNPNGENKQGMFPKLFARRYRK